jgi:hypothetical protein
MDDIDTIVSIWRCVPLEVFRAELEEAFLFYLWDMMIDSISEMDQNL